jgi:hypothetical protein
MTEYPPVHFYQYLSGPEAIEARIGDIEAEMEYRSANGIYDPVADANLWDRYQRLQASIFGPRWNREDDPR